MGQRYWVIGGEYRDCRFDEVVPGTEEISRPVPRSPPGARPNGTRLTFRDRLGATTRYVITAGSRACERRPRSAARRGGAVGAAPAPTRS